MGRDLTEYQKKLASLVVLIATEKLLSIRGITIPDNIAVAFKKGKEQLINEIEIMRGDIILV